MAKKKNEKNHSLYCDLVLKAFKKEINIFNDVVLDPYSAYAIRLQHDDTITKLSEMPTPLAIKFANYMANDPEIWNEKIELFTVNNWYWGGRQVYRFDRNLTQLLYLQTKDDVKINNSFLKSLPSQHLYISIEDNIRHGFFVSIVNNEMYIVDATNINPPKHGMISIPTEPIPLSDLILKSIKEATFDMNQVDVTDISNFFSIALSFIVYLSAINAEIMPTAKSQNIKAEKYVTVLNMETSSKVATTGQTAIISNTKKSTTYNVGYRLGKELRIAQKEMTLSSDKQFHSSGKSKSPHIRTGHFHSYWVGHDNNKHLEIKWIPPIFVNGKPKEYLLSIVHDVKDTSLL